MATINYAFTLSHVPEMLGEDLELLEAIVSNSDNLTYGSIISMIHRDEETITVLTDDASTMLTQILSGARRSLDAGTTFSTTSTASRIQTPSPASKRNIRGSNRSVTKQDEQPPRRITLPWLFSVAARPGVQSRARTSSLIGEQAPSKTIIESRRASLPRLPHVDAPTQRHLRVRMVMLNHSQARRPWKRLA